MITVDEALGNIFALSREMPAEKVTLGQAAGRILALPVGASRDQPPFAASAMDGYAIRRADAHKDRTLHVIGTAVAGASFRGTCDAGQAVRIFTGAPMPSGADFVVIQEDTSLLGDKVTLTEVPRQDYVRPAGQDFTAGFTLPAPRRLSAADVALIAAMGHAEVSVYERPRVALLSTGDELCQPGQTPNADQIFASNAYGLAALLTQFGAQTQILPIAPDTPEGVVAGLEQARGADVIVTIGGASVGDHDLVQDAAISNGLSLAFHKVLMRPGKPLMAGRYGRSIFIGLPGNPVSSMVCAHVFLVPLLAAMTGLGQGPRPFEVVPLAERLPANGPRAHFMRGVFEDGVVRAHPNQDSALLSVLADANCLICRPPNDGAVEAGSRVRIILLS